MFQDECCHRHQMGDVWDRRALARLVVASGRGEGVRHRPAPARLALVRREERSRMRSAFDLFETLVIANDGPDKGQQGGSVRILGSSVRLRVLLRPLACQNFGNSIGQILRSASSVPV